MAEPPKPIAVPPATPGGAEPPRPPSTRPIPPVPPTARPTPPPTHGAAAPAKRSGGVVLPLILLILLALIGGFIYLAAAQPQQLFTLLERAGVPTPAGGTEVAALQNQLRALQQRPQPAPTDLRPLEQRLASLEQRLGAVEARPAGDGQAAAPPVDLRPYEQRLAALEQRGSGESAVQELAGRLQAVEQNSQTTAAQASRTARLQAAAVALDAGKPLGNIPGAPAALTRFATVAPPTLYSLRQSFPAVAAAAHQASVPPTEGLSFTDRMLQQAQKLVTVHDGEKVLVGAPAARQLALAQARLDNGDLGAAIAALDGLDAEATRAMAAWRAEAQSLIDARSALAALAAS